MPKNYNDDSENIKDWTSKKLLSIEEDYCDIIYQVGCFSVNDILFHDLLCKEIERRKLRKYGEK